MWTTPVTISAGAENSPIGGISMETPRTSVGMAEVALATATSVMVPTPSIAIGNPSFPASIRTCPRQWLSSVWQSLPTSSTLAQGGCYVSGKSVMVPPKAGTFGTMGRNIFRDTGFKNVDFSVFKTFKFKERYSAQFRVEFFNLFNHPIIANPYGSANG